MMKRFWILLSVLPIIMACGKSESEMAQEAGARVLADARQAFVSGRYSEARDSIMALRERYPLALQARNEAIVLLDSIELAAAEDSLRNFRGDSKKNRNTLVPEQERLSVKVKFYKRKLKEDLAKQ